jgi:hypothetical protein
LEVANLRVETLTLLRAQQARINELANNGHFERPVFPLPKSFETADISDLLAALPKFRARFDMFRDPAANDVGYSFANDYFRSPDAEVFYTLVRTLKPERIIEIGSGNSTKVARQAILDGKLNTHLTSIDPQPRAEIDSLADECLRQPVEQAAPVLFDNLQAGDILFIDSSHEVRPGNDGTFIYSVILPRLRENILIQIHDIFLPYDYPFDLLTVGASEWSEQYLIQVMLACDGAFEVIWPGYFLQRTRSDFASLFPHNTGERAQSLWLRKHIPAIS